MIIFSAVVGAAAVAGFTLAVFGSVRYIRLTGKHFEKKSSAGKAVCEPLSRISDSRGVSYVRSAGSEMNAGFTMTIDEARDGLRRKDPVVTAKVLMIAGFAAGTLGTLLAAGAALVSASVSGGWALVGIVLFFCISFGAHLIKNIR
ncbi:MAG: hypothetical protein ACRCUT_07175 [Spirochaetota bacterium]